MKTNPTNHSLDASIIILNYFGEKVISKTIESVLAQNYPSSKYEIIIPDNASRDRSLEIISKYQKKHPNIQTLPLPQNLGFAGGNNRALIKARGKYIILLNNDCLADAKWLKNLIHCADQDEKIFSVSSKVLIYPKYFTISFNSPNYLKTSRLFRSQLLKFGKEDHLEIPFKQEGTTYFVDVPYDPAYDRSLQLQLEFYRSKNHALTINEKINPLVSKPKITKSSLIYNLSFDLTNKSIQKHSFNKIQNAGSLVFQDGYGRDIGATVKNHHGDYEKDFGQYDQSREVYSTCGAASLYRKSIINKIGFLNENFFMYYEDTELCERARLAGYKNVYCPTAVARHLHALSSKEWSPFFIFHTEKGRLLHLFLHFPFVVFWKQYREFTSFSLLRYFHDLLFNRPNIPKDVQYLKASWYFIEKLTYLLNQKRLLNQHNRISLNTFYNQILSGLWIN